MAGGAADTAGTVADGTVIIDSELGRGSRRPSPQRARGAFVRQRGFKVLVRSAQALITCTAVLISQPSLHAQGEAPGAPGGSLNWMTGNKQGLGTATSTDSKVWYTLSNGVLSEVYYPSGDTANVRSLEFAVTDGATFVDRESENTTQQIQLVDNNSLIYRQINTANSGKYQIIKTYVTDPKRAAVLIHVRFRPLANESADGRSEFPYRFSLGVETDR
jgi:glucoamylase